MEEVWYIKIFKGVEGPFTKSDLKKDLRITPDTFVWREGFEEWKEIKDVPELEDLFEEEVAVEEAEDEEATIEFLDDEIVLENQVEPPSNLYWVLIILIIVSYVTYKYFFGS